jgi:prephenate dehydrogenase
MAEQTFVPGRIGVVGLGLIGGSFAKALHEAGVETYVWNRTESVVDFALIESATGRLDDEIIPTCELIVLTTYPAHCVEWLETHADLVSPGAIVIDTAGTKRGVCEKCFAVARDHGFTFVGGHPMAGTEYSGFAHARADMFQGAPFVLVPDPDVQDVEQLPLIDRIQALLAPCGFESWTPTTPETHDRMIAYTSQLAHVVSNAYVKSEAAQTHRGFSAGSYKDLTRVARLNAGMWSELFLENRDYLVAEIDTLVANLSKYRDALAAGDEAGLTALLEEGDRKKRSAEGEL